MAGKKRVKGKSSKGKKRVVRKGSTKKSVRKKPHKESHRVSASPKKRLTKRPLAKKGKKKAAKKGNVATKAKKKAAPKKIQLEPLHTETLGPAVTAAPSIPPGPHVPRTHKVEDLLSQEVIDVSQDLFEPGKPQTLTHWFKMYSPVVITLGVGMATYFYLVFYLFYPSAILNGHWFQLLLLLVFIFLLAGIFIYLGLRSELLFVRILSFIFVFIIFTFLLLFVLLAHTLSA